MGKILIILIVAVVGWLLFKGLLKKSEKGGSRDSGRTGSESMVKCDICGVFMPESDSVQLDEKRTCNKPNQCSHRQAA